MTIEDTPPRHWRIICRRRGRFIALPVKKRSDDVRRDANAVDQRHRYPRDGDGFLLVGTTKVLRARGEVLRLNSRQNSLVFTRVLRLSTQPTQAGASNNV